MVELFMYMGKTIGMFYKFFNGLLSFAVFFQMQNKMKYDI